MKTLQTIIAITLLSLFSVSCSNDGDSDTNKPVLLLEKETHFVGYNKYIYDANNKLSVIENINPGFSSYKTTLIYNSNGKIEESVTIVTASNFPAPPTKITYSYDAQNRLIEKKIFQSSSENLSLFNYIRSDFFEYNGNLVTLKSKEKDSNVPTTRIIYDFDNKGNIIKKTSYEQMSADNPNGLISSTRTYVYDDKWNPQTSLPSEYLFPNLTTNNQLKSTNVTDNGTSITEFDYEYNTEGYATKQTVSGQPSSITYEYLKK
jgi:hypothetical protein